jgi:hypothetical protein
MTHYTAKTERTHTYEFKVLNNDNKLEAWTGKWDNINDVLIWYKKHAKTHINRGHILALIDHTQIKSIKTGKIRRTSKIDSIYAYTKTNPKIQP